MARYVYTGDGPHDATMIGGGLVRPGDVREYDDLPEWGAWTLVPEPKKPAPPPPAPVAAPVPAPVPAPAPPLPTPAPAPVAPAAATPAAPQNGS